jgi:hypothetical protein
VRELAQDHIQWLAFVLGMCEPLDSTTTVKEIGCEDGKWIELSQDHIQWQAM